MMKEVLQGNLSLRATIQSQSEQLDDAKAEVFQLQQENEDLRERLTVLEDFTGKDSTVEVQKLMKENRQLENRVRHLEKTTNNWNQVNKIGTGFNNKRNPARNLEGRIKASKERTRTIDSDINDDFEPVRPQMESNPKLQVIQPYDDAPHQIYHNDSRIHQQLKKSGFEQFGKQKNYRLTTTTHNQSKNRNLAILKQKGSTHNIITNNAQKSRGPHHLPNANSITDRSKVKSVSMGPKQMRAKTGKFSHHDQNRKSTVEGAEEAKLVGFRQMTQKLDNSTEYPSSGLRKYEEYDGKEKRRLKPRDSKTSIDNYSSHKSLQMDDEAMNQQLSSFHQKYNMSQTPSENLIINQTGSANIYMRRKAPRNIDDNDEPTQPKF